MASLPRVSTYDKLAKKAPLEGVDVEMAGGISTLKDQKQACNISWSDLNFTVSGKGGKQSVKVLDNVWGTVKSGEVCCIMGASGAGKSSLLNVLAGRSASAPGISIKGKITVNGNTIDPVSFRKNVAYVMQDDALMATASPREALAFSASLRLPPSTSPETIAKLVEKTITDLGLENCCDTMIGGPLIKGISGGQRKRTSVGVEVITQPALLFLDEPTSGLDSYSAFNCISLLKRLAAENTTILCTIHQPASEVFFLFDRCIFMKSGRIFYQGPTSEIVPRFSSLGCVCPSNFNPSDYIMQLSQIETAESCDTKGLWMNQPADFAHEGAATTWHVTQTNGVDAVASEGAVVVAEPEELKAPEFSVAPGAGFMRQLMFLTHREWQNTYRDVGALIGRFGVTIFLNLLFGLIFLNAGGKDDLNRTNFNGHFGALTMCTISSMFGSAQPVMLLFPFERPMFMREYSTGTYSATAYFMSKSFIELPLTMAQNCCQWVMVYFMCNFQGNGGYLLLASWGLGCASASVASALGCMVPDVKSVQELAPLLFVPQLLFAGFFIQTSQIPVFLRWAQYLCGIKYAMNLLLLTEFNPANKSCEGDLAFGCKMIIADNDIKESDWWIYVIILFVLFLGFRILGAYILTVKARRFY